MKITKVLIVEDNPADAELIRAMLRTAAARIQLSDADRLSSALSLLEEGPFDAVLLDLNLPDTAGLETLRSIQEKASHSAIVVLTGLDDERTGESAVDLGAQDYLVKGRFTAEVLRHVIRYAVGRKQVQLRLEKSEALSEARNRINDLITSTLDFAEIMNRCIGEAVKSVGAEAGLIGRFDEGGFAVSYDYGFPAKLEGFVLPAEEFRALAAVKRNGLPVISADAQNDDRINPEVAKRYGVRAAMFYPLFVDGAVTGALAFFNLSPRAFDDLEIDSARKIASSLSLALENAMLYEECRSAENRLRIKSAELELSNRELEQFASVASHDLQEPLASLASAIKLGLKRLKDKADEETLQFLSDAMVRAEGMQKLVRSLLAYSRVGRQPSFESADLERVLELSLKNLKFLIEKSGAVVAHDPLPRLFVDPILVSQLFQNLVGNAVKYRSERPPEIHISVELRENEYVFCIRDNGIGIPAEYRDTVFQIFRRIPGAKRTPGSGIGLATCKKIAELHGGRIWVESEEGKGASFFFTLPAAVK